MEYLTAPSVYSGFFFSFSELFHINREVQHGATFMNIGPCLHLSLDMIFLGVLWHHVACSSSPLPCLLLQHIWCGTQACAACSGPCQRRHYEMWICANPRSLLWNDYQQRFTHYNATTHMQRKEKGARLSPVVNTKCDCHLGFKFALCLISSWNILSFFLKVCSDACSQSLSLFFCTCSEHHWGWSCFLFLTLILNTRHISDTIQQAFTLLRTLDCSMDTDQTLFHTNSIIKKTRNLWFQILFTMCMITN